MRSIIDGSGCVNIIIVGTRVVVYSSTGDKEYKKDEEVPAIFEVYNYEAFDLLNFKLM